jgi:hypothetical protein
MALHLCSDLFDSTINRLGSMGDPLPFTPPDKPVFFTPLPAGAQPPGTPVIRTAAAPSMAPNAGGVQPPQGFGVSAAELAQFMAQARAAEAIAAQFVQAPAPVTISVPLAPPPPVQYGGAGASPGTTPGPMDCDPQSPHYDPRRCPTVEATLPPGWGRQVVLPSIPGSGTAVYAKSLAAPNATTNASSPTVLIAGGLAIAAIVGGFFFVLRKP